MIKRGYKPKKKLDFKIADLQYLPKYQQNYKINKNKALSELVRRCPMCTERYFDKKKSI